MIKYITLLEFVMKRLNPELLLFLTQRLSFMEGFTEGARIQGKNGFVGKVLAKTILPKYQLSSEDNELFKKYEKDLLELELDMSAKSLGKWRKAQLQTETTYIELDKLCQEFNNRLYDELESRILFSLEPNKQSLLFESNPFGIEVSNAFPSASFDIEEAGKCLAFERWVAAVFHLSRVAEIVTVTIGKQVGYESLKPGLGEVLKYLDNQLQQIRDDYKEGNPKLKGNRVFYSNVAVLMHGVNDAWRTKVSHMDTKYNEEEATRIWDTTKALMQKLAKGE